MSGDPESTATSTTDDADDGLDPAPRRPGTHHPRLARERALKVLFQADVRGVDARVLLDRLLTTRGALRLLDELEPDAAQVADDAELRGELQRRDRLPLDDYTRLLVDGVAAHRPAIDALLGEVAERWAVDRMPALDRNLLRLAIFELSGQDTPPAVVIDEALALAAGFAGERAGPFVNGVLETVRRRVAAGEVDLGPATPVPGEVPAPPAVGAGHGDARPAGGDDAHADAPPSQPAGAAAWADALGLLDDAPEEPGATPDGARSAPDDRDDDDPFDVAPRPDGPAAPGEPQLDLDLDDAPAEDV